MAKNSNIPSRLMSDLQSTFDLTREQAAGFVGNLAHESGGFSKLQEVKPAVKGSKGGYGYAQWTGPRRKSFEAFAKSNDLDPASYDANWGFLKHELETDSYERKQFDKIRTAKTAKEAATIAAKEYFRPAKETAHIDRRVKLASQVADEAQAPKKRGATAFTNKAGANYVEKYDFTPHAYTRNLPITDELQQQLAVAVNAADPSVSIRVTSGGQTSSRDDKLKDAAGGWTGSTRHDDGRAADFVLMRDGKEIPVGKEKSLYVNVAKNLAAQGVPGIGVKTDGTGFLHAGGGSEAAWGYKNGGNGSEFLDKDFEVAINEGRQAYQKNGPTALAAINAVAPMPAQKSGLLSYQSSQPDLTPPQLSSELAPRDIPQLNMKAQAPQVKPSAKIANLAGDVAISAPLVGGDNYQLSEDYQNRFGVERFEMPTEFGYAHVKRTPTGEDSPLRQITPDQQRQAAQRQGTQSTTGLFKSPEPELQDYAKLFERPERQPGRGFHQDKPMNTQAAVFALPEGVRPSSVGPDPDFQVIKPGLQMDGVGDGPQVSEMFNFGRDKQPEQAKQDPIYSPRPQTQAPQVFEEPKPEPTKPMPPPGVIDIGSEPVDLMPMQPLAPKAPRQATAAENYGLRQPAITPKPAPIPQERIVRDSPLDFLPDDGLLSAPNKIAQGMANGSGPAGSARVFDQPKHQGNWGWFSGDNNGGDDQRTTQQVLRDRDEGMRNLFTYSDQEKKDREGKIDVLAEYR